MIMLLNALQHMRRARLLRIRAQLAPRGQREKMLKRASLHAALARAQAENPDLWQNRQPSFSRPSLPSMILPGIQRRYNAVLLS
jgi:hypothetical protein